MNMRPKTLKTKIFLDSGNPADTKEALSVLGFLDGQTTNPSLVTKHPTLQQKIVEGKKLSSAEINNFYKTIITEISTFIPNGSVSIEVYADESTSAEEMIAQAREMYTWIPNAHIKFPTTTGGLGAAEIAIHEGLRVNMTLIFSPEQVAAVYAATKGAKKGDVFVSPFVGRLDDIGIDGMNFIQQCQELLHTGDGHVEVLVASVRSMDHFLYSLALGVDNITAPLSLLKEWAAAGIPIPDAEMVYNHGEKKALPPLSCDLTKPVDAYDITHPLTTKGIEKFVADWQALIGT
jgi:transaldolase